VPTGYLSPKRIPIGYTDNGLATVDMSVRARVTITFTPEDTLLVMHYENCDMENRRGRFECGETSRNRDNYMGRFAYIPNDASYQKTQV